MTTSAMRAQLIQYFADADEKKIKGLYNLLEEVINDKKQVGLTEKELIFLNEQRAKHINGESKSYTWDEVKTAIRQRKAL